MWQTVRMSCRGCEGFSERRQFSEPRQYRDIARQLMGFVEQGRFVLLKASCPLRELLGRCGQAMSWCIFSNVRNAESDSDSSPIRGTAPWNGDRWGMRTRNWPNFYMVMVL